jgi:hypothetical protein
MKRSREEEEDKETSEVRKGFYCYSVLVRIATICYRIHPSALEIFTVDEDRGTTSSCGLAAVKH